MAQAVKRMIGYARVSTEDQSNAAQAQALKAAGCAEIHEEQASGGNRARPVLARLVGRIQPGEALVVVRIDRLARSLSHLLEVIEKLEAKGAFFRSIVDPIDTASPQGKFTLQVLGAAAEFERSLIRERTKAGLQAARGRGRGGRGSRRCDHDLAAISKVRLARQDGYMERLSEAAQEWVPHVRRLRPVMAWEDVLRIINGPLPPDRRWTQSRLLRAVKAYVRDGFLDQAVLGRAGRRETDDRLPAIVAAIRGADPVQWSAVLSRPCRVRRGQADHAGDARDVGSDRDGMTGPSAARSVELRYPSDPVAGTARPSDGARNQDQIAAR